MILSYFFLVLLILNIFLDQIMHINANDDTIDMRDSEMSSSLEAQIIDDKDDDNNVDFDTTKNADNSFNDHLKIVSTIVSNDQSLEEKISWDHIIPMFDLSSEESRKLLSLIKFKSVWDSKRNVYRLLVDVDAIASSEAQMIKNNNNNAMTTTDNDNNNDIDGNNNGEIAFSIIQTVRNLRSIDHDKLFTLLLSMTKELATGLESMQRHIELLEAEKAAFSLAIVRYTEDMRHDLKYATAAEMRLQRSIADSNSRLSEILASVAIEEGRQKAQRREEKTNQRKKLKIEHEDSLLRVIEEHSSNMTKIIEGRIDKLREIYIEQDTTHFEYEEQHMQENVRAETTMIEADTAIVVEGIKYRAEVEAEVELNNFDLFLDIAYVQADANVETFSEVIRTMFAQVTLYGQQFFSDGKQVLQVALMAIALMVVLTLATETGTVLRSTIVGFFTRRQIVSKHTKFDGSHFTQITSLLDVYLPVHSRKKLIAYMQRLRQARKEGLPLPSLVVCGPPGVGKTLVAAVATFDGQRTKPQSSSSILKDEILNESRNMNRDQGLAFEELNLPVSMVCGGDLLAQGQEAALYLRRVFSTAEASYVANSGNGYSRWGNSKAEAGCMVVLDAFDDVVLRRDHPSASSGHSVFKDCLCAVLYSMKNASTKYGTIITCSHNLSDVDEAILDRMDYVITLHLPDAHLRYVYLRDLVRSMLKSHIKEHSDTHQWLYSHHSDKTRDVLLDALEHIEPENTSPVVSPKEKKTKGKTTSAAAAAADRKLSKHSISSSRGKKSYRFFSSSNNSDTDDESPAKPSSSSYNAYKLDLEFCLLRMVVGTEGYSYRELYKTIKNVENSLLATEECQLTNKSFLNAI